MPSDTGNCDAAGQAMKVSIIIPFQRENAYLTETIQHIDGLAYADLEIILLPDHAAEDGSAQAPRSSRHPVKYLATGPVSPAIKRDIGAENSAGELLAFIDDDAYPDPDWLQEAIPHFRDESVAAVGGPQVTPPADTFWQQVSGVMFLSILNGKARHRYWPAARTFEVDDWPSVNLIVRKADFARVGGFDSSYWPGEDTKLCYDLTQTLNKKILYVPTALVYHHRRSGFRRHLKQVGNYGRHRGFFAKRFPETSLRLSYFVPSLFFLFIIGGWILLLNPPTRWLYAGLWGLYAVALLSSVASIALKLRKLPVAVATVPFTVGTHFWYGYSFFKGFFLTRDLKSVLGR